MKIKITTPGFAGFSGEVGMVQFVDGVSVTDVHAAQLPFVKAIHTIEEIDGEQAPEQTVEQDEEVTPTGQEVVETPVQTAEVTSEEQKAAEEGADEAAQDDAAKE